MELWCDCPRQSIDFDSLRGAPPPGPQGRNRGTFVSATAKPETPVIPTVAQAEWRNPPRGIMDHHKIKLATWEDSSTPFHSARNDMSGGGSVQPNGLYSPRCQPLAGAGVAMNHRRYIVPCIGWYRSTEQVVFDTWRVADCRPHIGLNLYIPGFCDVQLRSTLCPFVRWLSGPPFSYMQKFLKRCNTFFCFAL